MVLLSEVFLFLYCDDNRGVNLAADENTKKVAICTNEFLTVRTDPYVLASKIDFLEKGEQVEILNVSIRKDRVGKKKYHWYKIKKNNGIIGWSSGAYLNVFEIDDDKVELEREALLDKEIKNIEKLVYGKFWSVNNQGVFTREKIYFFAENQYAAGRVNSKMEDGLFTVDPTKKIIEFDNGTSVGNKVSYIIAGEHLTLYGKRYNRTVRLIKGDNNPYSDDITKEEHLPDFLKKDTDKTKDKTEKKNSTANKEKNSNKNKAN
jgi:hypothetical protein